ncbi:MAG: hypothetical protein ABEH40_03505 [Haloferacaceae archaeon]
MASRRFRWRVHLPAAVAVCGLAAAMVGASAGAIPQPGPGRPVWYGLGALVVGYWAAFVRLARARRRRGR